MILTSGMAVRSRFSISDPRLDGETQALTAIGAGANGFPPVALGKIPFDRFAQASLQIVTRLPAEFGFDPAGIDRIAQIVSRPVGDEADQRPAASLAIRRQRVDEIADRFDK